MRRFLSLLFLAFLFILANFCQVIGQTAGEVFSAYEEGKFHTLMETLKDKRSKFSLAEMQAVINNMGKTLTLTNDQKTKLAEAAKPIVADFVEGWTKDTEHALRHTIATQRTPLTEYANATDQIAGNTIFSSALAPADRDTWVDAVHSVLTADQAVIWDKDRADEQQKEDQKFNGILDPAVKLFHERESQKADAFCHQVEDGFGLDEDLKAKLEALATKAVNQSTDQWRVSVRVLLKGLGEINIPPANFIPIVNNFNTQLGRDYSDSYDQMPVWTKGITDILTPAQMDKLKSFNDETIANRIKIMGMVFVEIMDQKVGLSEPQREQLKSISERLVREDSVLCPKLNADYNGSGFSPNYIYGLARKATDDELKTILDSIQLARWKENDPDSQQQQQNQNPPTVIYPPAPDMDKEPEYVEQTISRKMYDGEVSERKMVLDSYSLKIENLNRIISPPPELSEKIRFTVLALVEKQMAIVKTNSEQQMRAQTVDVTPESIDERLQTFANALSRFDLVRGNYGLGPSEFENLIIPMLSNDQLEALRKESDARENYYREAESDVITDDFTRSFSLDDIQRKKFVELVQKVMKEYGEDIPNAINPYMGGENIPWYLSPNLEFLPVIAINDTDLKTILTDDQLKQWHLSQEQSGAQNYWPQVEQFHQNRVQAEQQGKVRTLNL